MGREQKGLNKKNMTKLLMVFAIIIAIAGIAFGAITILTPEDKINTETGNIEYKGVSNITAHRNSEGNIEVQIEAEEGGEIYISTNGEKPTENSNWQEYKAGETYIVEDENEEVQTVSVYYRSAGMVSEGVATYALTPRSGDNQAIAAYSETDNSLTFTRMNKISSGDSGDLYGNKVITEVFTGFETARYTYRQGVYGTETNVPWHDLRYNVQKIYFDDEIMPIDTCGWFSDFYYLTEINLSGLNTSNVDNMSYMFYGCNSLRSIDLTEFDTTNANYMSSMFDGCYNLEEITLGEQFDFTGSGDNIATTLPTPSGENIEGADGKWYNIETKQGYTPEELAISHSGETATYVAVLKEDKTALVMEWTIPAKDFASGDVTIKLPVRGSVNITVDWGDGTSGEVSGAIAEEDFPTHTYVNNTGADKKYDITIKGNVQYFGTIYEDLGYVAEDSDYYTYSKYLTGVKQWGELSAQSYGFSFCENLKYVSGDATENTLKNVKTFEFLFKNSKALEGVDLSGLNTSTVTSMRHMFAGCSSLTNINFGENFDTSNVIYMDTMFRECTSLANLDVSTFDTSNVVAAYSMFSSCSSLTSLDVSNFNTSKMKSIDGMFGNCSSLTSLDVSNFNTSKVESMVTLFAECSSLTSLDLSNFDTSRVTNMGSMFNGCSSLISIKFGEKFDTSNVTAMNSMFQFCGSLVNLDVSKFNTSKVTTMGNMFIGCSNLPAIDVSNFDTSNVTNMVQMFYNCRLVTKLDVSNFNTSKVTDMNGMFTYCFNIEELDLSNFDTSNVTSMYQMFSRCQSLKVLDLSSFDTSKVTSMKWMCLNVTSLKSFIISNRFIVPEECTEIFANLSTVTKIINVSKEPTVDQFKNAISAVSGKTFYVPNENIDEYKRIWDNRLNIDPIINLKGNGNILAETNQKTKSIFEIIGEEKENAIYYLTEDYKIIETSNLDITKEGEYDVKYSFVKLNNKEALEKNISEQEIDSANVIVTVANKERIMITEWTLPSVTTEIKLPVRGNTNIIVDWGDGTAEKIYGNITEENLPTHTYINEIGTPIKRDIKIVGNVYLWGTENNLPKNMETYTTYLTGLKSWGELNAKMYCFAHCNNLQYIADNPTEKTFENVNCMDAMFYNCTTLTSLDLTKFNTRNVTTMESMFRGCTSLKNLDLGGKFNTSKVTHMIYMFQDCETLENITFGDNFKTNNVTYMNWMFANCYALKSLDLSNFDTSNVLWMIDMFYNCKSLQSLELDNWNTSEVLNMFGMFSGCENLRKLDLRSFDTSNVTNMQQMFYNCNSLQNIDLSNFNTANVSNMSLMFNGTTSLKSILISNKFILKGTAKDALAGINPELKIITISKEPVANQFNNSVPSTVKLYVPNSSVAKYLLDINDINDSQIQPILELVGEYEVLSFNNEEYVEEGATVAKFNEQEKENYEVYGYKVNTFGKAYEKAGEYKIKYQLTRSFNGEVEVVAIAERTVLQAPELKVTAMQNADEYDGSWTNKKITLEPSFEGNVNVTAYRYKYSGDIDWKGILPLPLEINTNFKGEIILQGVNVAGRALTKEAITNTLRFDNIAPQITYANMYEKENTITVQVEALDDLSGLRSYAILENESDEIIWKDILNKETGKIEINTNGSGRKYILVKDKAGNISDLKEVIAAKDLEAPKGSITLKNAYLKEDKKEYTNENPVILQITAEDNVTAEENIKIAILKEENYKSLVTAEDVNWENYISEKEWTITNENAEEKVYLLLKDEVGNISVQIGEVKALNVPYKVYHYIENINGTSYELYKEEEKIGTRGKTLEIANESILINGATYEKGSNINGGEIVETIKIKEDGTTNIHLYYKRNTYELTLEKGEHVAEVTGAGTYKYGETVNISLAFEEVKGYLITFDYWKSNELSLLENQSEQNATIKMPAGNVTLKALTKKAKLEPIAIYTAEDTTLRFILPSKVMKAGDLYNGKTVTAVYEGIETSNYEAATDVPWNTYATSITSVEVVDKVSPISTAYWFKGMNKAVTINVTNLDTSKTTTMKSMFYDCMSLTQLIGEENLNTSNVTDMNALFSGCTKISSLDINNWNTENVTDMNALFEICVSLTSLDLSKWDVGNVTNMKRMFRTISSYGAMKLQTVGDISNWNISNVTNMEGMFTGCTEITSLDLGKWDVGNVNTMKAMFASNDVFGFMKLKTIGDVRDWDTKNVTNMYTMFQFCSKIENLDLSNWNTEKVTDMSHMFNDCNSLEKLYLNNFDTNTTTAMTNMFYNCTKLQEVTLGPEFKFVGTDGYLPAQTSNNIPGADGKWYNMETFEGYVPSEIPERTEVTTYTSVAPTAFAVYSADDTSFTFYKSIKVPAVGEEYRGKTVTAIFTGIENTGYVNAADVAWKNYVANVTSVTVADKISPTSTARWFQGMTKVKEMDLEKLDTSKVTSMRGMFTLCTSLENLDVISRWDTSSLTDMYGIFQACTSLTKLDLSKWEVSSVTNMQGLFLSNSTYGNMKLKTVGDISGWQTGNVKNMSGMFQACSELTSLDLSSWDVSQVTTMQSMFYGAGAYRMKFKTLGDISNWTVENVTNMNGMFGGCVYLEEINLENWNTINLTSAGGVFENCYNVKNINLSKFNTSKATTMKDMFTNCSSLGKITLGPNFKWKGTDGYLPVPSWSIISGADGKWYDTNTNIGYIPSEIPARTAVTTYTAIAPKPVAFAVYSESDTTLRFYKSPSVPKAGEEYNGKVATAVYTGIEEDTYEAKTDVPWNKYITNITKAIAENEIKPVSTRRWFDGATNLVSADLNKLNTSKVTTMRAMFQKCNKIKELNIGTWDTSKVTDMTGMFNYCYSLEELDVSNWNTSNVENMQNMFSCCVKLTSLDLSKWDVGKVTSVHSMFLSSETYGYMSLISIGDVSNWNTKNVTNMQAMFQYCTELTSLDLSNWDVSNVENMQGVFLRCKSLEKINVSKWETVNVTQMNGVFEDCRSLISLDLSNWNTESVTNMSMMFKNCTKLQEITLGPNFNWVGTDGYLPVPSTTNITGADGNWYDTNTNIGYIPSAIPARTEVTTYTAIAPVAYAVYSEEDTTLRFYKTTKKPIAGEEYNGKIATAVYEGIESSKYTAKTAVPWNKYAKSITKVEVVDTVSPISTAYWFDGMTKLVTADLTKLNTANVTTMERMFYDCIKLTTLNGEEGWDTTNVTTMQNTFNGCLKITELSVSEWNTSNVTSTRGTFQLCTSLTILDLSKWNVGKVTTMRGMFASISGYEEMRLERIEGLEKWNTSKVTDMQAMFQYCSKLKNIDVSNWDVSSVELMHGVFIYCRSLENLDLSKWETGKVTTMRGMFEDCTSLTTLNLANWSTESVTDMGNMFDYCSKLQEITLGPKFVFEGASGYLPTPNMDGADGKWYDTNTGIGYAPSSMPERTEVTTYTAIAPTAFAVYTESDTTLRMYRSRTVPTAGEEYNGKVATAVYTGIDKIQCTSSVSAPWLEHSANITQIIAVDKMYPISTAYWFKDMTSVESIDLANLDTSNVTSMSNMFNNCTSLTELIGEENFDTQNVTSTAYMFNSCNNIESLQVGSWNTRKVANMVYMFADCTSLISLDVSNWNVGNVTSMGYMFSKCSVLTSLDVSNWNTGKVTSMNRMFSSCLSLSDLDVSKWDTKNVTGMDGMFVYCVSLKELNLTSWDVGNVNSTRLMFGSTADKGMMQLTSVGDLSNWDTKNLTDAQGMFQTCINIKSFGEKLNWNVEKLENMTQMFTQCKSLEKLDLSSWNTLELTKMNLMFGYCNALTNLDLSNFNTSKVTQMENVFYSCTHLCEVTLGSNFNWPLAVGYLPKISQNNVPGADGKWYDIETSKGYLPSAIPEREEVTTYVAVLPEAIAVYTEGNQTITFLRTAKEIKAGDTYSGETVTAVYEGIETSTYDKDTDVPWYSIKQNVTTVIIENVVSPIATRRWFDRFSNLSEFIGEEKLDTSNVTTMYGMFQGCVSLIELDLSTWNVGNVKDMSYMFLSAESLGIMKLTTIGDVGNWDTKNVENMHGMFQYCVALEDVNVSSWDVRKVKNMAYMFSGSDEKMSLESLDVSKWETTSLENMKNMFTGCTKLTTIDVKNWDTSNVTNMVKAFIYCDNLTTLDLSNWDTSKIEGANAEYMFYGCNKLEEVTLGPNFNFVGTNGYLPAQSSSNIPGADGNWYDTSTDIGYTPSELANVERTEVTTYTAIAPVTFAVYTESDTTLRFYKSRSVPTAGEEYNGKIATAVYAEIDKAKYNSKADVPWSEYGSNITKVVAVDKISPIRTAYWFSEMTNVESIDLTNLDTSKVTGMGAMFNKCTNLKELIGEENFDISNVTSMSSLFHSCKNIESIDVATWNTEKVTAMGWTFANCNALSSLDVTNWKTEKVTSMAGMFSNCNNLTSLNVANWTTGNVTNMKNMFEACKNLSSLNVATWNTGNVTNMATMFYNCLNLTTLDVSNWNTTNVTDMSNMFHNCDKLTNLDLNGWKTKNLLAITYMFNSCDLLKTLDLSNFDTSKVGSASGDNVFANCTKLEEVTLGPNFNFVGTLGYLPTPNNNYITGADGKWYDTNTGIGYAPSSMPERTEVTTYKAMPITYNVRFEANGGTIYDLGETWTEREVTHGITYGAKGNFPVAVREGYTFLGWYTELDGGTQITAETIVDQTAKGLTLYARWESEGAELISFTIDDVTYYAEEGMTWVEWCESEFCQGKYIIYIDEIVEVDSPAVICDSTGNWCHPEMQIIKDKVYHTEI